MNAQCDGCHFIENDSAAMSGPDAEACRLLREEVTPTAKILPMMLHDLAKHGRCPGFRYVPLDNLDFHLADVPQDLRGDSRVKLSAFMNTITAEMPANEEKHSPKCPNCEDSMERINRTIFMRVLFGSKRYRCRTCGQKWLQVLRYSVPI